MRAGRGPAARIFRAISSEASANRDADPVRFGTGRQLARGASPVHARLSRVGQAHQGERRRWNEKIESGSKRQAARAPFLALAHGEIRCQTGFCLFFPRDALIDAVHAQAPPRELCHDPRSHLSARATETAADPEACPALARWVSFLAFA